MCLIHRHQRHGDLLHQGGKLCCIQPLRRHVQQLIRPFPGALVHQLHLWGEGAVQVGSLDASLAEGGHLVLHEGDERRDDHGDALQHQGRNLVAKGLPAAGRHDGQHVSAGQDGVDECLLPLSELAVTKVVFQCLVLIHLRFLPPSQATISIPMIHGSGKKRKYPLPNDKKPGQNPRILTRCFS